MADLAADAGVGLVPVIKYASRERLKQPHLTRGALAKWSRRPEGRGRRCFGWLVHRRPADERKSSPPTSVP